MGYVYLVFAKLCAVVRRAERKITEITQIPYLLIMLITNYCLVNVIYSPHGPFNWWLHPLVESSGYCQKQGLFGGSALQTCGLQ